MMIARFAGVVAAAASFAFAQTGQDDPAGKIGEKGEVTDVRIVGHVYHPEIVDATAERRGSLRVPDGFVVETWAEGLGNPRIMVVGDDGAVYVSRRAQGDVLLLRDTDGDGRADERRSVASKAPMLHGLAIRDGRMYLTTVTEVYEAEIRRDGSLGELNLIMEGLPDGGQHPNRTLAFGPDGMLYLSAGSASNAATEVNPEHATILIADPDDGWSREIFANGLRNTIGFAWHPETGDLFGADHGIDWLGDNEQKEELNRIERGEHYGWPYVYADGKFNPADRPPEQSLSAFAEKSVNPELLYTAHSAPMMLVFYTGDQFPAEYRNDAFIAMRGSWNRRPPSGHEVVRVRFGDDGRAVSMEPFLTGFLQPVGGSGDAGQSDTTGGITAERDWQRFGRPVGLAVLPDGSMLVGDDTNGVIYRVRYE